MSENINIWHNGELYCPASEADRLRRSREKMERTIKVIYVWAMNDSLDPDDVMKQCAKALDESNVSDLTRKAQA